MSPTPDVYGACHRVWRTGWHEHALVVHDHIHETDPAYAERVADLITRILAEPQAEEAGIEQRLARVKATLAERGFTAAADAVPDHVDPVTWSQWYYRDLFAPQTPTTRST
jgi:hypothetical protein